MKKLFYIGSGILTLVIFFIPYIVFGAIELTPNQEEYTLPTGIISSCTTGTNIVFYDNIGNLAGGINCGDLFIGTYTVASAGTYTAVECLETSDCMLETYTEIFESEQYVSETEITWIEEEPTATSTIETGNIEFGLAIIITLLSIGVTSVVWRALYQNSKKPWQK